MLEYSLKFNTGTSYPTIDDNDILDFPIPLFSQKVQQEVKSLIEEGIRTKEISKKLLDIGKTGIEKAIEEDEKKAMVWMIGELDKLKIKLKD